MPRKRAVTSLAAVIGLAIGFTGLTQAPRAVAEPDRSPDAQEFSFDRELTYADYEHVIEHAFEVPEGSARIDVEVEYTGRERKTVLDLGLRGPSGLRGWSGGRETTVHVSTLTASLGYLPGPIEAGTWRVVIGVPNIREGSRDTYRARVRVSRAMPVTRFPALRQEPGWYAGDLHLHTGHSDGRGVSASGSAIPAPVHRAVQQALDNGLDFAALTDHNTAAHWADLERLQPFFDSLLLLHGREITTYRGHANAIGERAFTDFTLATPATPLVPMLSRVTADGAFLSINHALRPDNELCMGCGWNDTSDAAMRAVHGVEVVNGEDWKGTLYGWPFWASALNRGFRLTLVGGSDDHTPEDPADLRAGTPTTMVWARELSEGAIVEGLKLGRTYLRVRDPQGPRLALVARAAGREFQIGDEIPWTPAADESRVTLDASLVAAEGQSLQWIRNGVVIGETRVPAWGGALLEVTARPGDWFSLVVRDAQGPTLLSGAIYVASR
jgi:hypothetical protein